jgi:hypothetical protein
MKGMAVGEMTHGEYIDDFFAIGTNKKLIERSLEAVIETCAKVDVPAKISKVVYPNEAEEAIILGINLDADGLATPVREKLSALVQWTKLLIRFRTWNKKMIERVLGRWAWILLLRRPLFSVLEGICKFDAGTTGKPSYEMRCELLTLVKLAPLIQANLAREFAEVCLATDASLLGGGVTYTYVSAAECLAMHKNADHVGTFTRCKVWKTAVTHKWEYRGRIDILEGEAVLLGLKWFLRDFKHQGKRVIFLVDNMALKGALRKGRSPSKQLDKVCRRVAAHVLGG